MIDDLDPVMLVRIVLKGLDNVYEIAYVTAETAEADSLHEFHDGFYHCYSRIYKEKPVPWFQENFPCTHWNIQFVDEMKEGGR